MNLGTMAEYHKLLRAWKTALAELEADVEGEDDFLVFQEQRTEDDLIDFIEANDLNYTEYDIRGARQPY